MTNQPKASPQFPYAVMKVPCGFFQKDHSWCLSGNLLTARDFMVYCRILVLTVDNICECSGELLKHQLPGITKLNDSLVRLKAQQLIEFEELPLNNNSSLYLVVAPLKDGYFFMNRMLFRNYIKTIGAAGWAVLCLLSCYHNKNFRGYGSSGCACPTLEQISQVSGVKSQVTVLKYLSLLEQHKLLRIIRGTPILTAADGSIKKTANLYIAQNRLPDNQYYLSVLA